MVCLETVNEISPLAQTTAWRSLGTRFSGDYLQWRQEDVIGLLLLFGVLVGGFFLLAWLSRWQSAASQKNSPAQLAKELAAAHGLSYRERRLCREVASEHGLGDAAELFVRIDSRERVAAKDPALAKRLFGSASA